MSESGEIVYLSTFFVFFFDFSSKEFNFVRFKERF